MKASIFVALFAALALALYVPATLHAQNAAAGKEVYAKKCQTCHAADGSGNPAIAKSMKLEFKHLGSDDVQKKSDAELKKDITGGFGKMKPVAGVSGAEVDNVVAHLRTLKKK
jgi:cytochrome c5